MVAYVFDKILQQGVAAGEVPARTRAARDWFRETASGFRTTPNELIRGAAEAEANCRGNIICLLRMCDC